MSKGRFSIMCSKSQIEKVEKPEIRVKVGLEANWCVRPGQRNVLGMMSNS